MPVNDFVPNKNLTLIYKNIEPNLELKLFISGQLTLLLEKCPNNCHLTAKLADLEDHYHVQLGLMTPVEKIFSTGDDDVIAGALEKAMEDLQDQMHVWKKPKTDSQIYELF